MVTVFPAMAEMRKAPGRRLTPLPAVLFGPLTMYDGFKAAICTWVRPNLPLSLPGD